MNIITLLQTQPVDSLNIQQQLQEMAEKLSTTSAMDLLQELLDKAITFGLKVLAAIIIYMVGAWAIRKLKAMMSGLLQKRNADAAIVSFVQSITGIVLTILLIIITIGALGIDTTSIAALLAGGGMAIGLALNGTVQNFAGGIMIIVFKPFKAGDYIEAQGHAGTVAEVNIVSTELLTVDNRRITIPNGALFGGTINNYSEMPLRRVDWTICVEYGSPLEQTKAVIMDLVKNDARVLGLNEGAPADPFVALSELSENGIKFTGRVWVKSADYWDVFFSVNEKVYTELPKAGIKFPFHQMDVHIHQEQA